MNEIRRLAVLPVINSVLSLILSLYLFSCFAENRKKGSRYIVIISGLAFALALVLVHIPLIRLIITTLCTLGFSYRYTMKLYNRFLLTALFVAISMLTEIASSMSIMLVFNTDYSGSFSGLHLILGSLLAKFLAFYIFIFRTERNVIRRIRLEQRSFAFLQAKNRPAQSINFSALIFFGKSALLPKIRRQPKNPPKWD